MRFEADGTEALRMPADVGTALFRSVQEGLSNVTRHARATEIALSLRVDGDLLTVTLADNGVGFEPANGSANSGPRVTSGLGLASVRERLESVRGRLDVRSGETGTTLTMQAPLSNEERCA